MTIRHVLSLLFFLPWGPAIGHASVRIADDYGGRIGDYIKRYKELQTSRELVVIDGDCVSACTLVLSFVPKARICVTPRARFGFHTAWDRGFLGTHMENSDGTHIMWDLYPNEVKDWIMRQGGLSAQTLYLEGSDLRRLYPTCH